MRSIGVAGRPAAARQLRPARLQRRRRALDLEREAVLPRQPLIDPGPSRRFFGGQRLALGRHARFGVLVRDAADQLAGALLPGTTAFALSSVPRVSRDRPPLYLPLVWHSAQRALRSGAIDWPAQLDPAGLAPPG